MITEALPEKHKENAKQIRNPRHPPTPVTKKLGEGHYLDRRSGTGRVYSFFYLATDPEKKEEEKEILAISRMTSTKISTLNKLLSKLSPKLRLPLKRCLKKPSLKNPKLLLLRNTIRAKESNSTIISSREGLLRRPTSMPSGSRRRS